jgi:hypothetical protein
MFGNSAFAQFAFCGREFPKVIPAPNTTDGFKRGERKKLAELTRKLERAQELRFKSAIKEKEQLSRDITAHIAPELLPPATTVIKPATPARPTLTLKTPDLFDADIKEYIEEINRINRARWFRVSREYQERMEAARLAEIEDEETLLLLL